MGITICELIIGHHMLRHHDDFKRKQEIFVMQQLIDDYREQEQYFLFEEDEPFHGFTDYDIYARTLRLKCNYWRRHFGRNKAYQHIMAMNHKYAQLLYKNCN